MTIAFSTTLFDILTLAKYQHAQPYNIQQTFQPIPSIYEAHSGKPRYEDLRNAHPAELETLRPHVAHELRMPLSRSILAKHDDFSLRSVWQNRNTFKDLHSLQGHKLVTPEAGDILVRGSQVAQKIPWTGALFIATNATGTWTLAAVETLAAKIDSPELATGGLFMYAFSWITYGLMLAVGGSAFHSLMKGKKPEPSELEKRFPELLIPTHRI